MNKLYPKTNKKFTIHKGSPYPMGTTLSDEGVNFALFSSRAEKVELCLFDDFEAGCNSALCGVSVYESNKFVLASTHPSPLSASRAAGGMM